MKDEQETEPDDPIADPKQRAHAVAKLLRTRCGLFAKATKMSKSIWALWWVSIGEIESVQIHYPIHSMKDAPTRDIEPLQAAKRWETMGPRAIAREIRVKEAKRANEWERKAST